VSVAERKAAARAHLPATEPRDVRKSSAYRDLLPEATRDFFVERPVVCVQGLGFVGAAMAAAVAAARAADGTPCFNIAGVDLDTPAGRASIENLRRGTLPFETSDDRFRAAVSQGHRSGNLTATVNPEAYSLADVIVVDVNLDLGSEGPAGTAEPVLHLDGFRRAIETIGRWMRPGALVIVETTVPPGTCARVAAPILAQAMAARGLPEDAFLLAHSYERVMPGKDYFDSIVNFWRVYAGHTEAAAEACAAFLSRIINIRDFPLRRLSSTTASETAKVLENSYRAVTIALMDEWGRFAEAVDIDLFEVVDAIRQRPTHSNMRQPGFGVGGYCLPKDPLMALAASRQVFGLDEVEFPFCRMAVEVNRAMPLNSVGTLEGLLGGNLKGKRVALMGVSYRPDVADTRYSPAQVFIEEARRRGALVTAQDPLVESWPELSIEVARDLPDPSEFDALVFATAHAAYREIDPARWLGSARPAVLDANDVLSAAQRRAFADLGCALASIGRGRGTACGS
jgi:UDP-N-acetyl-D-glucosamine dehydrogenase